jgi:hypothetical protein
MPPQSKGGSKTQKKTNEHYKDRFLNTHKVSFMLFFAIKVLT